ncbi:unnamed protein product [Microthlaspi erraticum]|uniref:Uncharacterized protein n=1 Tax=Microthlaspi erraticum TaxID=1685480 RepID=A0A6D2HSW7_9BRAS|nr:unnamed protein product [Microthlaspi erraticum]CAA7052633.1 unnamed protein product [Microthlaspi erraticum]
MSSSGQTNLGSSCSTQGGQSSTQPPLSHSPSFQVPESESSARAAPRVQVLTVDQVLLQEGRHLLTQLHPLLQDEATWFGISNNGITKCILRMLHSLLKHPYPTYSSMPADEKEMWFRTFAQEFNWDSVYTSLVRTCFHQAAASSFTHNMNEWKAKWKKGSQKKPKGMNAFVWQEMPKHWLLPETENDSLIHSNNRMSNRNGLGISVHNSGATSTKTRQLQMTKEAGCVCPDYLTLVEDTHTNKKTGEIQDPAIRDIVETVKKRK